MKSLSILSIALVAAASPTLAQSSNPLRTTTPMRQFSASSAPAAAKTTSTPSLKQMQETQMSYNRQYLQLQNNMQQDNRSYTAVSNIMKSKHDTIKNSIQNVR